MGRFTLLCALAGCGRINFDEHTASSAHSTLILDRYDAGETLLNFPVLLALEGTRVDMDIALPDGSDLRVYDEAGTPLPLELEEAAPVYLVWVLVPRIEGRTTKLTLSYGDPNAPRADGIVWPDSDAVWHFGSIFGARDATPNHHDGSAIGNAIPGEGFRGAGWDFDGASALIVDDTGWQAVDELTVSGLIFMRTNPRAYAAIVSRQLGPSAFDDFFLGTLNRVLHASVTGTTQASVGTGSVPNGGWHALALTYSASLDAYVDGVFVGSSPGTGTVQHSPGNPVFLGANRDNTDGLNDPLIPDEDFLDGMIDEVRIEHVARSPAWIAACGIAIGDAWVSYGPIEHD